MTPTATAPSMSLFKAKLQHRVQFQFPKDCSDRDARHVWLTVRVVGDRQGIDVWPKCLGLGNNFVTPEILMQAQLAQHREFLISDGFSERLHIASEG